MNQAKQYNPELIDLDGKKIKLHDLLSEQFATLPCPGTGVMEVIKEEFFKLLKQTQEKNTYLECFEKYCVIEVAEPKIGDVLSICLDCDCIYLQRAINRIILRDAGSIIELEIDPAPKVQGPDFRTDYQNTALADIMNEVFRENPDIVDKDIIYKTPEDSKGPFRSIDTENSAYFIFSANLNANTGELTSLIFSIESSPREHFASNIAYKLDLLKESVMLVDIHTGKSLLTRDVGIQDVKLLSANAAHLFSWWRKILSETCQ